MTISRAALVYDVGDANRHATASERRKDVKEMSLFAYHPICGRGLWSASEGSAGRAAAIDGRRYRSITRDWDNAAYAQVLDDALCSIRTIGRRQGFEPRRVSELGPMVEHRGRLNQEHHRSRVRKIRHVGVGAVSAGPLLGDPGRVLLECQRNAEILHPLFRRVRDQRRMSGRGQSPNHRRRRRAELGRA